jgi:hypothetical protein
MSITTSPNTKRRGGRGPHPSSRPRQSPSPSDPSLEAAAAAQRRLDEVTAALTQLGHARGHAAAELRKAYLAALGAGCTKEDLRAAGVRMTAR